MPSEDIFDLDMTQLDKHWLEQPGLVYKYAMKAADAKDRVERAKARLDVGRAEVKAEITTNPSKFHLAKTTDSAINSAIELHATVTKYRNLLFKRKHEVDILAAMLNALEHRKRALEGLVSLNGQEWFAEPRTDKKGRDFINDGTKKRAAGMARKRSSKV